VVTVAAPTVSEALAHRNTLRALKKGLAVLDVVASGTSSAAVAAIQSRARQAADDAAREAWHKNGPDPAVARIVGSRLLGSSG
jgi:hypothetical protein